MKFGCPRVSTSDQDASLQRDALKAVSCNKIIVDQVSGRSKLYKLDVSVAPTVTPTAVRGSGPASTLRSYFKPLTETEPEPLS